MNTKLNADQSATFLATKLRRQEPFSFWRFGDGFLELQMGKKGGTCDGEQYTAELGIEMATCVGHLVADYQSQQGVYFGDWLSASFKGSADPSRYETQYLDTFKSVKHWLHFEALLLMRESEALIDFYRAVAEDPRRKLYIGPLANAAAAQSLGSEFLAIPMNGLSGRLYWLGRQILSRNFDVLLFGAGMAGNIPVIDMWDSCPERTYISLGSALDPLGRGRSRKQQISPERARELFRSISAAHTAS